MKFKVNGKILHFEYVSEGFDNTIYVKCKENGKYAFLYREEGILLWDGELGTEAVEIKEVESARLPYGYRMWGGELRDDLPHGARYYLGRR